jgi:hypothetical protein
LLIVVGSVLVQCRLTAPLSNTNQGQNKSLSSCFLRGRENNLVGNTKRGKRVCTLPLQGDVQLEISHVSQNDRFAAMQIVMVTKRLLRLCPFY